MKARLSIFTEDKTSLFFNTICDIDVAPGRAQLSWQDKENGRDQFMIGINRKKITVLRINKPAEDDDGEPEEEFFVLSVEKNEPSKGVISFDTIDLYFSTDEFKVKIGKSSVEAELECMLGIGDHKTDPQIIRLVAYALKPSEELSEDK